MKNFFTVQLSLFAILFLFFQSCGAPIARKVANVSASQDAQSAKITFDDVKESLFYPKCLSCHNSVNASGSVDLTSYETVTNAKILVPYNAEASLLYQAVANGSMPPGGNLSEQTIQNLKTWINEGAPKDNAGLNLCQKPTPILPRITPYEYGQILNDLMGGNFNFKSLNTLPTFPTLYGFDRLSNPTFDRTSVESYFNVAEEVVDQLLNSAIVLSACNMNRPFDQLDWNSCAQPILLKAGQALFRRPLRSSEIGRLRDLFIAVQNLGANRIRTSTTPISGHFDGFGALSDGVYAMGWAYDPEWPERNVSIKFYVRSAGSSGVGKYLGSTLANLPSPEVNSALGITGDRGFYFPIPAQYLTGAAYEVSALTYGTAVDQNLPRSPLAIDKVSVFSGKMKTGELNIIFRDALRSSLISLLISPQFLFKLEYFPGGYETQEESFRQAALLSLLIGSTYPDQELVDLANRGSLSSNELSTQANRLLNKYADRFANSFGGQWIGYKNDLSYSPRSLTFSMGEEGRLVFRNVLLDNSPISSILQPGYTYLNSVLGTHYGLSGSNSTTQFLKVTSNDRGGMLNQGQFLIKTANVVQTNPIKRGVWVLDKVLCRSLPPLDAATFEEIANSQSKIDPNAPLIERMKAHRQYGNRCATCHSQIDPLGLPLENWDMTGRFRSQYADGKPVVSDLAFEGQTVGNPTQLAQVLSHSQEYRNCVRAKLEAYVKGIDPTQPTTCGKQITSDRPLKDLTTETIVEALEGGNQ